MSTDEMTQSNQSLPARSNPASRFGDVLIGGREAILNKLSGVTPSLVINKAAAGKMTLPQSDLAAELKKSLDHLKLSAMDETGETVDYAALRASPAYAEYQTALQAALGSFEPDALSGEKARRAFWINLYNALVLDAVIAFGVQRSVTEGRLGIMTFFRRAAYQVDGRRVSLEDIEHGILRANRGNPYVPGPHFASDDPRLAWSLPLDPRLHFALNCGGRSCPPIQAYTDQGLDQQLELATRVFLAATVEIKPSDRQLWLSTILKWYAADFGGREGVLDFLAQHLPDDDRRDFLLAKRGELQLRYHKYDWRLNDA